MSLKYNDKYIEYSSNFWKDIQQLSKMYISNVNISGFYDVQNFHISFKNFLYVTVDMFCKFKGKIWQINWGDKKIKICKHLFAWMCTHL